MSLKSQMAFWVAALVLFVLLIWLLHEILLPFVAGIALAYLLDPLANRIEHFGIGRLPATFLILGLFVFLFLLSVVLLAPVLGNQLAAFVDRLPDYAARLQSLAVDPGRPWLSRIVRDGLGDAQIGSIVKQATGGVLVFVKSLWSGGQTLVSILSLLIVTPVVAFYLLNDWNRMVATVDHWLPRAHAPTIRALAREIDRAIAGFVRGQSGVCLILGSFYALGLTVTGLNFGLLIGALSGLISFIPYVGSFTGLVLSLGVAVAQFFPDWGPIVAVLAVYLIGQFLEGYVLAPYLVGPSVGLHPVWLMFALVAFGYLFGFVGLLIAVPLAAAIGVLVRFALKSYLASSLYWGGEAG
ncbi:MAG TPA: AI-2E family transporter [Xanthobacteraceae bacterium]|jgi:predicted PurR-regulated permease PerM|nr:AI-2E family transporter [Xanthobacteraceae bacterium]